MKNDYNTTSSAGTVQTNHIGFIQVHKFGGHVEVVEIVAEQENNADAEWNVLVDGSNVFAASQSVASADAPETFTPDQNRIASGASMAVELDVTASSGTAGNLHVGVGVEEPGR
jgi:hypothetical protein